jgi:hypothetical protein
VDRRFADDELDVLLGTLRDELVRPVPGDVEIRHLAQMSFARRETFEARRAPFARSRRAFAFVACAASTVLYGGLSAAGALPNPAEVQDHVTHWFGGDEAGTDAPSPATNAVVPGRPDTGALPPPASPLRTASVPSTQPVPGDSSPDRAPATPEQSQRGDAPGHGATDPGHGGTPPGQTDPPPANGGNGDNNGNGSPPGQAITTPADGATEPGHGGTPPGQTVAPGQNGTPANDNAPNDHANENATQHQHAAPTNGRGNGT